MTTHTTGFELNPKWDSFCSFILFWHFKIINNFTRGLFEETVIVYITSAVAAGERGRGEREWGALAPLEFFRTEILKITVYVFKYKMLYFETSVFRQFFEKCKDGNDMGRLEVFMRLEIFSSLSRMFNLLLPRGMKCLKTKTHWYIISKYLWISYNDWDTIFHATMILTHILKLTKLLVVKIITKHTALKTIQVRLLRKYVVLRISCFNNAVLLYWHYHETQNDWKMQN